MRFQLGLNTCGPATEQTLQTLVDAGLDYVYLDGPSQNDDELAKHQAAVKAFADRLSPWSIHLPVLFDAWDFDDAATTDRFFELLERASGFGVSNATMHVPCYVRIGGGAIDPERSARHRERVMRTLRAAAERAHELGIDINIENGAHPAPGQRQPLGYCVATAADLREYLRVLDSPYVGVCLDTGHAMLAGQNPGNVIRELGELLHETHFNDNFGPLPGQSIYSGDYHRPPGIGRIDWLDVMDALDEIHYPNPVVFELGMVQVGGDAFEFMARATHDNWRAFERARAKRDGQDPTALA